MRAFRSLMCLALVVSGSAALSNPICVTIDSLFVKARGEIVDLTVRATDGKDSMMCSRYLGLGGVRALQCGWHFDYRNIAAHAFFDQMTADVSECAGFAQPPKPKNTVNHPDSYDLRTFVADRGLVAVSLKDKAALGQTLVFLRIEATP